MAALITYNDIKATVEISANLTAAKTNRAIRDAQNIDIKDAIGDGMLLDLLTALDTLPLTGDFANLYNGCTYTYYTNSYSHVGLKEVACLYAYARLIEQGDIVVNQFGTMVKESQYSSHAEDKEKARLINATRNTTFRYLMEVKNYIIRNITLFPKYEYYFISNKKGSSIHLIGN